MEGAGWGESGSDLRDADFGVASVSGSSSP